MRLTAISLAAAGLLLLLSAGAGARDASLRLRSPEEKLYAPLGLAGLSRVGAVAMSGTPSRSGGFLPACDRRLDTRYEARDSGPAEITLAFLRPQALRSVRILPGDGACRWSLAAADSVADLDARGAGFRELVPERPRPPGATWDEVRFPTLEPVRAIRLRLTPSSGHVVLREWDLIGEQTLESIHLQSDSAAVPLGDRTPIEVIGFFSGGETRPIEGRGMEWLVTPPAAARMTGHGQLTGLRKGPIRLVARFGRLSSSPLPLEVVDPD